MQAGIMDAKYSLKKIVVFIQPKLSKKVPSDNSQTFVYVPLIRVASSDIPISQDTGYTVNGVNTK